MRTYAVYRLYYGADWIIDSINSVLPHVDRVFVFFTGPILGDGWNYDEDFPADPDGAKLLVRRLGETEAKLTTVITTWWTMDGQMSHFINDVILPYNERPDAILINECDHVWRDLPTALSVWRDVRNTNIARWTKVRQIELWKPPQAKAWWKVPHRPQRTGPVLWDMREGNIPQTIFHGVTRQPGAFLDIDGLIYNLGYAVSEESMRWKVKCSAALGTAGRDSMPDLDYVDQVYLPWVPGDGHLEISVNYREHIPKVTRLGRCPF